MSRAGPSLTETLSARFALMVGARAALLLLGLATTAFLTRSLGLEGFGHYRTAVAYLSLAMIVTDFGLGSVFVREISLAGADQSRVVGSALTLRLAIAALTLAVAVGLALVLDFDPRVRLGIIGGSAGFVAYSLHTMLFGLFQQKLRQHGAMSAEIAGGLVLLLSIAVLARLGADAEWFVTALGLSYAFTLALSLAFARRLVHFGPRVDVDLWKKLIRAVLPLAASGVLLVLYVRADIVLLALFSTPEEVGLYGVPIKVSDSGLGVSLLFIGLFAPLLARSAHAHPERFARHLQEGMTALLVGGVAAILVLNALAAQIVVVIAGEGFRQAAPVLRVLSGFLALHPLSLMLREAVIAKKAQRRLFHVYGIGAIVALALYVPLIRRFGGVGAAGTLVIAELVVLSLLVAVIRSEQPNVLPIGRFAPVVGCGLFGALALVGTSLAGGAWWMRLSGALIAYLVALLLTGTLRASTLGTIVRGALPGR